MLRKGGAIGQVNVTWEVQSDPDGDLLEKRGVLVFAQDETKKDLVLKVRDDIIPEMEESFTVVLKHVSKVSSASRNINLILVMVHA